VSIVPPTKVEETLQELKTVVNYPLSKAEDIIHARNVATAAQIDEAWSRKEIDNMLIHTKFRFPWDKSVSFFTNKADGFGKDDLDEAAYKNFQIFGEAPKGTDSYNNYWKSIDILGTFTNAERQYVNNDDSINTAVNDAITDKTGQRLVELLTELRDNTKELHLEERP
jgi:hypothetical protein